MTFVGRLYDYGLKRRLHYDSHVPEQQVSVTVHSQFLSDVLELAQCALVNVILVDSMPASGVA